MNSAQAKPGEAKLATMRKAIARHLTEPVVGVLVKTSITPNTVTWIGFALSCGAAALIVTGRLLAAGFAVLVAGFFDILDGALARRTNQITRFGGILDSTIDRICEAVILLALMVFFLSTKPQYLEWIVLLIGVTLISSFLVSYIRARAETLSINCEVGVFTRTERVILLAIGLLINQVVIVLAIIALLSIITVVQRLVHVYKRTKPSG